MVLAETKETIEDIAAEAQAEIASGQRTCRVNAQDDTYVLVQQCFAVSTQADICAISQTSFKTKLANTVLPMLFQVS